MLFIKQNCDGCGQEFDSALAECPNCKNRNKNYTFKNFGKGYFCLPYWLQLAIFGAGFFGLAIFEFFFICIADYLTDKGLANLLMNAIPYTLILLGFIAIVIIFKKSFGKNFSRFSSYVAGPLVGIALIGFQLLCNLLIEKFGMPIENNVNENAVESLLISYPVISIFVVAIAGPIVEEFTYRLGLFSFLCRKNRVLAYIFTILVFALIHFSFDTLLSGDTNAIINELLNLPVYIISGALLTYTYDRWGLPASIIAHMIVNIMVVVVTLV